MTTETTTLSQLAEGGAVRLARVGIATASEDAVELLAHLTESDDPSAWSKVATAQQASDYADLLRRREGNVPLEYLTGRARFRGIDFLVGPGVYVPQPVTETLIDVVTTALGGGPRQNRTLGVDLCTGSGVVAITLAAELGNTSMAAVERDQAAADWADRNVRAQAMHLERNESVVELFTADALSAPTTVLAHLRGRCDVVASNPPYVGSRGATDAEIRLFAPEVAIMAGDDGLSVIRDVVSAAIQLLRPGGLFAVEHEDNQGDDAGALSVPGLLRATGMFDNIVDHRDSDGFPRVTSARLLGAETIY